MRVLLGRCGEPRSPKRRRRNPHPEEEDEGVEMPPTPGVTPSLPTLPATLPAATMFPGAPADVAVHAAAVVPKLRTIPPTPPGPLGAPDAWAQQEQLAPAQGQAQQYQGQAQPQYQGQEQLAPAQGQAQPPPAQPLGQPLAATHVFDLPLAAPVHQAMQPPTSTMPVHVPDLNPAFFLHDDALMAFSQAKQQGDVVVQAPPTLLGQPLDVPGPTPALPQLDVWATVVLRSAAAPAAAAAAAAPAPAATTLEVSVRLAPLQPLAGPYHVELQLFVGVCVFDLDRCRGFKSLYPVKSPGHMVLQHGTHPTHVLALPIEGVPGKSILLQRFFEDAVRHAMESNPAPPGKHYNVSVQKNPGAWRTVIIELRNDDTKKRKRPANEGQDDAEGDEAHARGAKIDLRIRPSVKSIEFLLGVAPAGEVPERGGLFLLPKPDAKNQRNSALEHVQWTTEIVIPGPFTAERVSPVRRAVGGLTAHCDKGSIHVHLAGTRAEAESVLEEIHKHFPEAILVAKAPVVDSPDENQTPPRETTCSHGDPVIRRVWLPVTAQGMAELKGFDAVAVARLQASPSILEATLTGIHANPDGVQYDLLTTFAGPGFVNHVQQALGQRVPVIEGNISDMVATMACARQHAARKAAGASSTATGGEASVTRPAPTPQTTEQLVAAGIAGVRRLTPSREAGASQHPQKAPAAGSAKPTTPTMTLFSASPGPAAKPPASSEVPQLSNAQLAVAAAQAQAAADRQAAARQAAQAQFAATAQAQFAASHSSGTPAVLFAKPPASSKVLQLSNAQLAVAAAQAQAAADRQAAARQAAARQAAQAQFGAAVQAQFAASHSSGTPTAVLFAKPPPAMSSFAASAMATAVVEAVRSDDITEIREGEEEEVLLARFIVDVNLYDDDEVCAGSTIVKKWKVENLGGAAWTDVELVDDETGQKFPVPHTEPNEEVDVQATVIVPKSRKVFSRYFHLEDGRGRRVPLPLWIRLRVITPPKEDFKPLAQAAASAPPAKPTPALNPVASMPITPPTDTAPAVIATLATKATHVKMFPGTSIPLTADALPTTKITSQHRPVSTTAPGDTAPTGQPNSESRASREWNEWDPPATPATPEAEAAAAPITQKKRSVPVVRRVSVPGKDLVGTATLGDGRDYLDADVVGNDSYPDGALVRPGTEFEKMWRVKNTSSVNWLTNVKLVDDVTRTEFNVGVVLCNSTSVLRIKLTAPAEEGSFERVFRLVMTSKQGEKAVFGEPLCVRVVVDRNAPVVEEPKIDLDLSKFAHSKLATRAGSASPQSASLPLAQEPPPSEELIRRNHKIMLMFDLHQMTGQIPAGMRELYPHVHIDQYGQLCVEPNPERERAARAPRLRAQFKGDANLDDGTRVRPGMKVVKKWALENTGEATWEGPVKLVPNGLGMTSFFVGLAKVGEVVEACAEVTAPMEEGIFSLGFHLEDHLGRFFGPKLWLELIVTRD